MKRSLQVLRSGAIALMFLFAVAVPSSTLAADETIKIAFIDPLSGAFAASGDATLKHLRFIAERINAQGGILGKKLEIVPFDNKMSAQESLHILQEVADRGIHYITQGLGSHVAGALVAGVTKHNRRHPDNKILYFNFSAEDPALTNDKCSFWHFRFVLNDVIKAAALTDFIAQQKDIKKVFLINMDYAHGQTVSRVSREMLAKKRPDIEIVGDILHPLGKVKDFSPYIAEIQSSGADAVITGNWGPDLSLLIKAGAQAGLDVEWYTSFASSLGVPTAIGEAGIGNVFVVSGWQENLAVRYDWPEMQERVEAFEKRYDVGDYFFLRIRQELRMLKKAMEQAGTTDPVAVAYALEGMTIQTPLGTVTMRADNHQILRPLFISVFTRDYLKYDAEGTGLGWKSVHRIRPEQLRRSTSCEMQRPPRPEEA